MAFGYKPNTSQITSALNDILESRQKREAAEQASEERILALQRDAFESDRDWNEKLANKVKSNLEGLISGAKDERHYNVQSFRDSYLSPLYEIYKDTDGGFGELRNQFAESGLSPFMSNQIAGLIWSAGVNNTDHVPVIEFADLINNEIHNNEDWTFEDALEAAGVLPPGAEKNRNQKVYTEARNLIGNHQEVIELNQKLQSFYQMSPSQLIKNVSSSEFDMGKEIFSGEPSGGGAGGEGGEGGAGGGELDYEFPFSTNDVESVFNMDANRQTQYFSSIGWGSPVYSMDMTEDAMNQNLALNAQAQLGLDKMDDQYLKNASEIGYDLTNEDMGNLNRLIELRRTLLENEATVFTNNLSQITSQGAGGGSGSGGGGGAGGSGGAGGGAPDETQYGYMGEFGADVKNLPASLYMAAYNTVMNMGATMEDNVYASNMKTLIRKKSQLGKAEIRLRELQEIPVEKRRTDYDNTLRIQTERIDRLREDFDDKLLEFNNDFRTNFDMMSIPYLEQMQHQGSILSKDNSPNDIMKRKR